MESENSKMKIEEVQVLLRDLASLKLRIANDHRKMSESLVQEADYLEKLSNLVNKDSNLDLIIDSVIRKDKK